VLHYIETEAEILAKALSNNNYCFMGFLSTLNYFMQGTEICQSDDIRQETCLNPEKVLNKRLRVDKRNKLRINFHRFQEVAR
jgi:hypothetical protein